MQRCKGYKEDYVAEAVLQKMRSKRLEVEGKRLEVRLRWWIRVAVASGVLGLAVGWVIGRI